MCNCCDNYKNTGEIIEEDNGGGNQPSPETTEVVTPLRASCWMPPHAPTKSLAQRTVAAPDHDIFVLEDAVDIVATN